MKAGWVFLALAFCLCFTLERGRAGIVFPEPPAGGEEAVVRQVGDWIKGGEARMDGLKIEEIEVGKPYRMHNGDRREVAKGDLLKGVWQVHGWWYPLSHEGKQIGTAGMHPVNEDDNNLRISSIVRAKDTWAVPVLEVMEMAEKLPQVKERDYELRFLHIPEFLRAVWLHGENDEIVIPVPPVPEPGEAYRVYSARELGDLLQEKARVAVEKYDEMQRAVRMPLQTKDEWPEYFKTQDTSTPKNMGVFVQKCLYDFQTIKVGATREEIEKKFPMYGSVSSASQKAYAHPDCPYFGVEVEYECERNLEAGGGAMAKGTDKAKRVSRPFVGTPGWD